MEHELSPGSDDPMAQKDILKEIHSDETQQSLNPEQKTSLPLATESFMSQVIQRDALNQYKDALTRGDLNHAVELGFGEKRQTIAHELEQLRLKDMLGDPKNMTDAGSLELKEMVEQAMEMNKQSVNELQKMESLVSSGDRLEKTQESLNNFAETMTGFYDYLESMIPPSVKVEYIKKRTDECKKILQEHSNDPNIPKFERFIKDLEEASVRNGVNVE